MKSGLTEMVFILDKSGSMGGLEKDTIGGYNSMLEKQKSVPGEARISTVLFNHSCEILHDRIDIRAVNLISEKEYCVGGNTALFDAIGSTIQKIVNVQKNTAEDYRAEKVIFVIITDGEENASREHTAEGIKQLIERQKANYGWEFVFLGANIDAEATAKHFGIAADRAQKYHADSKGVSTNFQVLSSALGAFRKGAALPENWQEDIKKDYEQRGKKK